MESGCPLGLSDVCPDEISQASHGSEPRDAIAGAMHWQEAPDASQRGAVLIMVLICMSLVAVIGSLMMREVTADYASTASQKATTVSGPLLDSGMVLATDLLMIDKNEQKTEVDHLREPWNDFSGQLSLISNSLESGTLDGSITDESGLFPLAGLRESKVKTREAYEKVFIRLVDGLCRAHGQKPAGESLLKSLQNWEKNRKNSTPDDDWYRSRQPPYSRAGRNILHPGELLLLRWDDVSREGRERVMLGTETLPGLVSLVSCWAEGPININTAPREIVMALSSNSAFAGTFYTKVDSYRRNPKNSLSGNWYTKIARATGMNMGEFPGACIGDYSNFFRVRVTADIGANSRSMEAVFKVSKEKTTCLYRTVR